MEDRLKFKVWDNKDKKFLKRKPTYDSAINMITDDEGRLVLDFYDVEKMDGGDIKMTTGQYVLTRKFIGSKHDSSFKIVQCTGLKIKNKLLYEKDKFKYSGNDKFIYGSFESVVEWDNEHGAFYFMHETVKHFFSDFHKLKENLLDYCEIIGTIYENNNIEEKNGQ